MSRTFDRNSGGAWTLVNYGNGVSNARTFNLNMQLASIRVSSGTDYFYKTYGYNEGVANNGKIAAITDNLDSSKSISYTYDELNRLATAATSGPDWGLSWSYDRYGNRLSQNVTKGTAPSNSLSINSANNRVSTWTYDAVGNVTNDGRNTYAYDAENRVISINNGATTYTYGAGSSRLTKTTGGTTTRYYFGVAEKTNSSWTKIQVGIPGGTVEWDNGTILFKSNDQLGTPRIITNASGALIGQTDLFPYGEVWSETGTQTKYKFSGKERDAESGNDYFGERYLNNTAGRFLTVDPVIHLNDPQSFNAYVYTRNDPVNLIDPDGADPGLAFEDGHFIGYSASLVGQYREQAMGYLGLTPEALFQYNLPNMGYNLLIDPFYLLYERNLEVTRYLNSVAETIINTITPGQILPVNITILISGVGAQPSAVKNPCTATNAVDFIQAHKSDAIKVANTLNVPTENILGLSGIESSWGKSNAAIKANNFFGLHGGTICTICNGFLENKRGGSMSAFPSYLASAQSFAAQYGGVQGIKDPEEFAKILIKLGFNSGKLPDGNPNFIPNTADTIINTGVRMRGCQK